MLLIIRQNTEMRMKRMQCKCKNTLILCNNGIASQLKNQLASEVVLEREMNLHKRKIKEALRLWTHNYPYLDNPPGPYGG